MRFVHILISIWNKGVKINREILGAQDLKDKNYKYPFGKIKMRFLISQLKILTNIRVLLAYSWPI